jgi:ABC transport system ATP-binding/permease protein
VEQIISRMQLDPSADLKPICGHEAQGAAGARAGARPDLLLLDEPTNHLDIDAIDWLEDFLKRWGGTLFFVTHDRVFLQRLATRIVELDRGRLFDWNCDYATFLQRKEALLAAEQEQNVNFDKKLAQEEQWIRKGIEARRTRNEGRVRALKRLRELRRERREQAGKARMQIQSEKRSGKLVIDVENVSYSFGKRADRARFFNHHSARGQSRHHRPERIGQNHPAALLMGELTPQQGSVRLGTNPEVAYFDQLRAQLDESKSVLDNVGQGRDTITDQRQTAQPGRLPGRFPVHARPRQSPHQRPCRAASATGCCWRACWPSPPTCLCWMSPPTTWILKRSKCWKTC